MSKLNKILVTAIVLSIVGIGFILTHKEVNQIKDQNSSTTPFVSNSEKEPPKIVSTKPNPLEDNIVSATDVIEITFNRPLQNIGEFKLKIEPKIDFKIELSSDRKTAKIIPAKPFELGVTYTIFIGPETKFDGMGNWGLEKIYHFKTVTYRGV